MTTELEDIDKPSHSTQMQDGSQQSSQTMIGDTPTLPHGMPEKTALQYAIAALRDYPDMFQERIPSTTAPATSLAQQVQVLFYLPELSKNGPDSCKIPSNSICSFNDCLENVFIFYLILLSECLFSLISLHIFS